MKTQHHNVLYMIRLDLKQRNTATPNSDAMFYAIFVCNVLSFLYFFHLLSFNKYTSSPAVFILRVSHFEKYALHFSCSIFLPSTYNYSFVKPKKYDKLHSYFIILLNLFGSFPF